MAIALTQPNSPLLAGGWGVTGLIARYLEMLTEAGVPHPLEQSLTLAAVLADLLQLAGEPVPDIVTAALEGCDGPWAA